MREETERQAKQHELINNQPRTTAGKTRVLVIDDDRSTRFLLRQILTHADFEVLEAEDGEVGLRMAAEEKPALVLVDGLLPKMHGFLVCKAIKELDCPPRVIVLTAVYRKITYRWEVKTEYGADELLIKPINGPELVSCIERVLSVTSESDVPAAQLPAGDESGAAAQTLHART